MKYCILLMWNNYLKIENEEIAQSLTLDLKFTPSKKVVNIKTEAMFVYLKITQEKFYQL